MKRSSVPFICICALLGSALLSGCCHSLRHDKVPPEQPYLTAPTESVSSPAPPVGFSSEPATGALTGAGLQTTTPLSAQPTAESVPAMPGVSSQISPATPPQGQMGIGGAAPSPM